MHEFLHGIAANCKGQPVPTFWFSEDGDSTTSLGTILITKLCYLVFRCIFLYFGLCPLPLVLSVGTTERSLALSSLHFPFKHLQALISFPQSLLFSSLNSPRCLSLSLYQRCSRPLVIFVTLC